MAQPGGFGGFSPNAYFGMVGVCFVFVLRSIIRTLVYYLIVDILFLKHDISSFLTFPKAKQSACFQNAQIQRPRRKPRRFFKKTRAQSTGNNRNDKLEGETSTGLVSRERQDLTKSMEKKSNLGEQNVETEPYRYGSIET